MTTLAAVIRDIDQMLMRWGVWRTRQELLPQVRCDLLGRLLGESAEAARKFGQAAFSNDKPYAALIRGIGQRPESQDDDQMEWSIQAAMDAMPDYMVEIRTVLYIEYLSYGTPEKKARSAQVSRATYCSHRRQGQLWIQAYLQGRFEKK